MDPTFHRSGHSWSPAQHSFVGIKDKTNIKANSSVSSPQLSKLPGTTSDPYPANRDNMATATLRVTIQKQKQYFKHQLDIVLKSAPALLILGNIRLTGIAGDSKRVIAGVHRAYLSRYHQRYRLIDWRLSLTVHVEIRVTMGNAWGFSDGMVNSFTPTDHSR